MCKKYQLSVLALSITAFFSSPVIAAERIALQSISLKKLQENFYLTVPGAVNSLDASENVLRFIRQHTDARNITHVRMQQEYAGYPVFGGYAILHHTSSAKVMLSAKSVAMNGTVYRNLHTELGAPPMDFVSQGQRALQQFRMQYHSRRIRDEHVEPMVYINEHHEAFWAYKVSVLLEFADKIPERPTAIIDAHTFQPFVQWNTIKTIRSSVHGMGYGGNQRTGQYQYGKDLPFLLMTRDEETNVCYMENARVKVIDMSSHYEAVNEPMKFNCGLTNTLPEHVFWTGYKGNGYDEINQAYSPSNDALYAGHQINQMYKEWYGTDVLMKDNSPMQLVMRVHFGKNYENAFWDGQQMTFGDGHRMMYPLVSLGVGAHEISHGFTEQYSDLEYFGQSGGMNESFSDMAAQTAQYYAKKENDWLIGAEILRNGTLRYMDHPSRDGQSIDTARQYRKGLNVHYSSGVYNRLFYLLANQPGWNPRSAFHVMLKANMDYWTPTSTFNEGACGVISAAQDLNLSVADVKQVLDIVAIDYDACSS